jgi:hypothetical protein
MLFPLEANETSATIWNKFLHTTMTKNLENQYWKFQLKNNRSTNLKKIRHFLCILPTYVPLLGKGGKGKAVS